MVQYNFHKVFQNIFPVHIEDYHIKNLDLLQIWKEINANQIYDSQKPTPKITAIIVDFQASDIWVS